jgi:hypothetical protein
MGRPRGKLVGLLWLSLVVIVCCSVLMDFVSEGFLFASLPAPATSCRFCFGEFSRRSRRSKPERRIRRTQAMDFNIPEASRLVNICCPIKSMEMVFMATPTSHWLTPRIFHHSLPVGMCVLVLYDVGYRRPTVPYCCW